MNPTLMFIFALLSGAGSGIIAALVTIGRYQARVDVHHSAIESISNDVKEIVSRLGNVEGQLERINGHARN